MKFTAVGDVLIQKRVPEGFEPFEELSAFIKQGDARFFNLETTLNYPQDVYGSQFSGGTYIRAYPEVLNDVLPLGFNMVNFNNNHVLDFSYPGMLSTLDVIEKSGLTHAGVGRNLAEASAPGYLSTKNGRVALIAVNTAFNPSAMAGEQSLRFQGRPGINGLRVQSYLELPQDKLDVIKEIASASGINADNDLERREGYMPELASDETEIGNITIKLGDKPKFVEYINPEDIARVDKAIYEAQLQADYIIISIHTHCINKDGKEFNCPYIEDFARHCIDQGANAVVGHGPHRLRAVEVYKNSPIFYSLGDFFLQLYSVEMAPQDFYNKQKMKSDATVHELLKKRSKDFTIGLMADPIMSYAVIPYWETDKDKKLTKLTMMPVEMIMDGNKAEEGLPRRSYNRAFAEKFCDLCKPYGVDITIEEDGMLTCKW